MMVVDPRFFSPFQVDIAIVRNTLTVADGNLSCVLDVNGNVIFIIKDIKFSLHDRHILLDSSENPILTFQKKRRSIHRRWQAFRGDSTNAKDLIFSTKKKALMQRVTELNAFLSNNKDEEAGDYKVVGDWKKRSCAVYSYDGDTILAQMHDKHIDTCLESDNKDTYGITVSPNADYALVVALMVILYEVNKDRKKKKKIKGKKKDGGSMENKDDDDDHIDEEDEEDDEDDNEEDDDSD
ncbi:protein LURP-one-related 15-like [Rutidosis leptorrhynchoides]|uniref:protein LURP-one-related 15-like n=1 Tax=Rutidosis leptorrhynchoides TaxID=125765 RepID=UPI003A998F73